MLYRRVRLHKENSTLFPNFFSNTSNAVCVNAVSLFKSRCLAFSSIARTPCFS
jgi:hypothetical protein